MALLKLAALGALGYVAYKFYEKQKSDSPAAFATGHHVTLSGLAPNATYYFRVRSRDRAGNLATSPVSSFRTRAL